MSNQCPTCQAKPGEKCQTIYYVRQADGTYAAKGKATRTHKGRD